jgi:hypothetical protein
MEGAVTDARALPQILSPDWPYLNHMLLPSHTGRVWDYAA